MPTVIPVRMHFNTQDLWFDPQDTGACKGDHVVVSTERGTELGLATSDPFEAPCDEVKGELKPVLRVATDEDLEKADELAAKGEEAMPVFRQLVKECGLDMKPVGVEFLFGGEKAVFYFAAEDRVDFRDLVRELASRFHQRVDMRQIGVRDEARLVGGYAPCGQELCCVRFGSDFEPVSIRMAKEQDLPLNSSKISGVCGRLMCCLRYEFEAYRDFKQRAPKKNAVIDTPLGKAKIVEYNTPRETLRLRLENGKSFVVALKDMTCSEGCCKRSAEQHIPLRPDTVTREALEQLGTPDIIMQLAELDRANDPTGGYRLDDSLLENRRTPRRRASQGAPASSAEQPQQAGRRQRGGQKAASAEAADPNRTPRRRGSGRPEDETAEKAAQQPRRQRKGTAQPAAEGVQEQQNRPRGGGMRPRRKKREQQGAVPPEQAEQPREARDSQKAAGDSAPRRARRHHTAENTAPANPPATPEREERGGSGNRQRPHRVSGEQKGAEGQTGSQGDRRPRERSGDRQQPQGHKQGDQQPRQRRQHRNARTDGGASQQSGTPEQRQPRRRRPGDHGGAAAQGDAGAK